MSDESNRVISDSALRSEWERLLAGYTRLTQSLGATLEASWAEASDCVEVALKSGREGDVGPVEPTIEGYRAARSALADRTQSEALEKWHQRRPMARALSAAEEFERGLTDLTGGLAEWVTARPSEVRAVAGPSGAGILGGLRLVIRRRPRSFALRAAAAQALDTLESRRIRSLGALLAGLAEAGGILCGPWEEARSRLDRASWDPSSESGESAGEAKTPNPDRRWSRLSLRVRRSLAGWKQWHSGAPSALGPALVHAMLHPAKGGSGFVEVDHLAHWVSLRRGLEGELILDRRLRSAEEKILQAAQASLQSLEQERQQLQQELGTAIGWLHGRLEGRETGGLPPAGIDVTPARSRLAEWEASLDRILAALPRAVTVLSKLQPLPGRKVPTRHLDPAAELRRAYDRSGRRPMALALEVIENAHSRVLQDLEQAREVVAFAEEEKTGAAEREALRKESLRNSIDLVQFCLSNLSDWRPSLERQIQRALARVFYESRLALRRDRLGTMAYLAGQGGRRAVGLALSMAGERARLARGRLAVHSSAGIRRFLVWIGWRPPEMPGRVEVIRRPMLPDEFIRNPLDRDMPALYRRLFRIEPIENPHFLVGREREIAAVLEARALWESNRPAGLLIVGERGSGKTSLINCALKRPLDGLEVVRGEFSRRITQEEELRRFLARLVGLKGSATLETSLQNHRRVVILEELERAFLREPGSFEAVKALQRVIAATASSTLWIAATNRQTFRFLQAALGLGDSFSHRIDAADETMENLRQAIMLRHRLSGLRLQFVPQPSRPNAVGRLRRMLGEKVEPEQLFFEALSRESDGIFRAAFEIWLNHIDFAEGGVLSMRPIMTRDLAPVADQLTREALFTLVSVMQHGSLTAEEHARVFHCGTADSLSMMDGLAAREILQQDPRFPGMRVRPEAMRVVREALYRRNLI